MEQKRNSSIETLRIISLFMIMLMHGFGNVMALYSGLDSVNSTIFIFINAFCNCAVTCFVLITGYYGIRKREIKKLVSFELMMIFYMLLVCGIRIGLNDFVSTKEMLLFVIKAFIPFTSRINWFYSCYLVLYLLAPFINILCKKLSKKELISLLCTLIAIFYVLPTIFYFEITQDYGKGVVNVIIIYLIGRAIHMYYDDLTLPGTWCFLAVSGVHFILNYLIYQITGGIHNLFSRDNGILVLMASIWLFYWFKSKCYYKDRLNRAAKYVFPILVSHNFIMKPITLKIVAFLEISSLADNKYLTIFIILLVAALCLVLGTVEFIRKKLFGRLESKLTVGVERGYDFLKQFVSSRME